MQIFQLVQNGKSARDEANEVIGKRGENQIVRDLANAWGI